MTDSADNRLTQGSLNKAIWLLSVPMMLEMAMESVFAVTDVFFVGRISTDAVAVVGFAEAILWIIYSLGFGLSIGATAMVARRIGEKRPEEAAIAAVQAVWLGVLVSIPVVVVGVVFSEGLLRAMGASPELAAYGKNYLIISLGSTAIIMLLFINNAVFRAAGDAKIAMYSLWLANGINIVLDPLLIFGLGPIPALGLEGAAIASVIGRLSGVFFQAWILARGTGVIRLSAKHLRFRIQLMLKLARLSIAATIQQLVESASWIILVRLISAFGPAAVAGYTIAMRILVFAFLPAMGMANAAATLVGQNLGAERPDRAEKAVWRTCAWAAGAFFVVMLLFIPLAGPLVRLFVDDPEVVREGSMALYIVSYGYVTFAVGVVLVQAFNGAGDTTTPLWLSVVSLWFVKLPMAYLLAEVFEVGSMGIYLAITISYSIMALIGGVIFRQGKWKTRTL